MAITSLPSSLLAGPFRGSAAVELGITRDQLGGGRYARLFRDVYVAAELAADPAVRRRGALLLAPHSALSHVTAAAQRGWPLPTALERGPVHVGVEFGAQAPRARGLIVHELRLQPGDIVEEGGLRITSPERTITDLSAWMCLADLVAMIDYALRVGHVTRDSLRREVDADRAHRGVRMLRKAVELTDARSESPRESRLRVIVVMVGLPTPEVNVDIHGPDGRWLCRGDLPYFEWKLLLEYDGVGHLQDTARQRDLRKRNDLTRDGWRVLAYGAEAMAVPDALLVEVWEVLTARGWPAPGPRPPRLPRWVLTPPRRPR